MIPSSECQRWQTDRAANPAQEQRSYTTPWGTIGILGDRLLRVQSDDDLQMGCGGCGAGCRSESAPLPAGDWATTNSFSTTGAAGFSLDQWARSPPVRIGLRPVDALRGGQPD